MNIKKLKVDTDLDSLKVNRKKTYISQRRKKKNFFCFFVPLPKYNFFNVVKKKI